MYLHGRGKISNLMNKFLHEFLDLTPAIILTVLFCKVNIILFFRELLPKNYAIFHYGMITWVHVWLYYLYCSWWQTKIQAQEVEP